MRHEGNMKTVYFVRHGQSEANVSPVFQPPESPLTEKGKQQARFLAERASFLPIQKVISSTMARAEQTADIIAEQIEKKVELSDLFREREKPSTVSGKPRGDTEAAEKWNHWLQSLVDESVGKVEDGEAFAELKARALKALHYLSEQEDDFLIVVTHGFFMRMLVSCVLIGEDLNASEFNKLQARLGMELSAITVLRHDPTLSGMPWRVWIWNDHAHLG